MILLVAAHFLVGGILVAAGHRVGRLAWPAGALPMAAMLGAAVAWYDRVLDSAPITQTVGWVGALDLSVTLRLDGFALLMVVIISGIGSAVLAYGASYFAAGSYGNRVAGLLVVFAGSMLGMVLADNVILLYVFWELTSITSFFLIGGRHTDAAARSGALHALIVTGAGGLALLAGLVLLAQAAGTYSLTGILATGPRGGMVVAGLGLVLVGIVTKSAQYPTHAWLPAAMVAPTPISAYLHSATMVKAGIYLAARLAPVFATTAGWRPTVLAIGAITMILGGLRALRQHDLKLLLALGTVSQLGFLLVLMGTGRPDAVVAGATLLLAHAVFKATLFLVVGIVDKQAGTRDRRSLSGFGRGWLPLKVIVVVAAASMAGLPPLFGFIAKESAFKAFADEGAGGFAILGVLVLGAAITFAYSARLCFAIVASPRTGSGPPAPAPGFLLPAGALAAATVALGVAAGVADPLITSAARSLDPRVEHADLALWHGLDLALAMSLVAVSAGLLLVAARRLVNRWQDAMAPGIDGDDVFTAIVHAVNVLAHRVTGVVQTGSLPMYGAVILLTAVGLPVGYLIAGGGWAGWPTFANTPSQPLVATAVVTVALATAIVHRRFAAVIILGAVGYGMGLIFLVQGAPDLALTQVAVETLTIVVFMLVLRHLPETFGRRSPPAVEALKVAVAATVAVGVFALAMASSANRVAEPISEEIVERSLPEAEGKNVVNVILVDFRGLDTLGEISVLVVAGIGAAALARAGRRPRGREDAP